MNTYLMLNYEKYYIIYSFFILMNKVFLFLFIAATLAVNDSTLESTLQADNFKCSDLENMFNVKNQL